MTPPTSLHRRSARHHSSPLPADLPTGINSSLLVPGLPSPGWTSPHASSHRNERRYGNMNPFPIDYAFRPRLRGRLTLRGLTLRRNPWTFGESVSHTLYRYSCQHSHFRYLQQTSRFTFAGLRNAPLPHMQACVRSFGVWLEPRYIFGAGRLI